jgi:hypothetical protein
MRLSALCQPMVRPEKSLIHSLPEMASNAQFMEE